MELYDAMRCAPTSRRFTAEPVDPDSIVRALDAARFAPSGGNRQAWRVIVVRDPGTRRALRDLYLPHWRAYLELTGGARMLADPEAYEKKRTRMVQRANEYAEHLDEVPVHLVLGVQQADLVATDDTLPRTSIVGGASVYPFAQNLLLALRVHRALLQVNGHHDRGIRRARFPGVLRGQQQPAGPRVRSRRRGACVRC